MIFWNINYTYYLCKTNASALKTISPPTQKMCNFPKINKTQKKENPNQHPRKTQPCKKNLFLNYALCGETTYVCKIKMTVLTACSTRPNHLMSCSESCLSQQYMQTQNKHSQPSFHLLLFNTSGMQEFQM